MILIIQISSSPSPSPSCGMTERIAHLLKQKSWIWFSEVKKKSVPAYTMVQWNNYYNTIGRDYPLLVIYNYKWTINEMELWWRKISTRSYKSLKWMPSQHTILINDSYKFDWNRDRVHQTARLHVWLKYKELNTKPRLNDQKRHHHKWFYNSVPSWYESE